MSESRMNGGELAEYTASAEVCMTFLNVNRSSGADLVLQCIGANLAVE
jgi:hypothetical protein